IDGACRARIVNIMCGVFMHFTGFDLVCFQNAVYMMDRYLSHCQKAVTPFQMNQIGVTCCYLAAKVDNLTWNLNNRCHELERVTGVPKEAVLSYEREILKVLEFTLNRPTPYDAVIYYHRIHLMKEVHLYG
ncbi:hypothetical protein KIPB_012360, partial [Kipferlia bialata]